ncbi:MAG: DEAD/DEAH box helicase [Desulfobacteraceae bacterium]|jgi:SNF2 family DNA or RNA helicase
MSLLKITKLNGTPVFTTFSTDTRLSRVYGATRIDNNPLWYYPAFYPLYRIVLRDFETLKIPLEFSEATLTAINALDQYTMYIEKQILPKDFVFKTRPYAHQLEGLIHVLYNFRAALFYACGLGKTKIIIDWQRAVGAKLLILCPRVVLNVWALEIQRHGIDQEFRIIDASTRKGKLKQLKDTYSYSGVVVSYDTARNYCDELRTLNYNAIIADESHYIKGYNSNRSESAIELSRKASRRIIMSGTPSTGDPRDLWSQFRFLSPCFIPEAFWKFKNTYCETSPYNKRIVVGYKNLDVLNKRINIVALCKTKQECLDLPQRQIIDVLVDLEKPQQRVYNTLIYTEEYDTIRTAAMENSLFTSAGVIDIPNAAILVNKLLQVTCGFVYLKADTPTPCDNCQYLRNCVVKGIKPFTKACLVDQTPQPPIVEKTQTNTKLTVLLHKLKEILIEPTHKCIIWCQFDAEMDLIQEAIEAMWQKEGVSNILVRVDGSTRSPDKLVEQFNNDVHCRVYLGQVETGVGVTLNAATYMIYFSLPWKLLAYDQSIDRNHRVGQKNNVTVFRLIARGTVDVHVARALDLKRTVSETIVATLCCDQCKNKQYCEDNNIKIFESKCIYKRQITRSVTRARSIKNA